MKVELKEMRLRNFKGVTDKTFSFAHNTIVKGTNGTGKTTINDGFTFILFGKDSNGRSDFGYKRRDENCEVIHELEYGGELVFDIDGIEKRFERVVVEKWGKARGSNERFLSGNESAFYIDRVRCATKKEFDSAVAEIASEDVMRMMTDVNYFVSQKDDVKKSMLIKLAYGVSDIDEANEKIIQEVLEDNPNLADFISELGGVHVKEYNARLTAKIKAVKDEIETIPTKIGAKLEAMPQDEDWDTLQSVIDENKAMLSNVEAQIRNENAANAGTVEEQNKIRAEISNKEYLLVQAENKVRAQINAEEFAIKNKISQIDNEMYTASLSAKKWTEAKEKDEKELLSIEKALKEKREQYKSIKNGEYSFTEEELVCPTCGRGYDKEQLTEQKLKENKNQGMKIKADYDSTVQEITLLDQKIKSANEKIKSLGDEKIALDYKPQSVVQAITRDTTCQSISQEIETLKKALQGKIESIPNTSSLIAEKREIEEKINVLMKKLGTKDTIATIKSQVDELKKKQTVLHQELGDLEYKQETSIAFQKAKDEQLLKKINRLFSIVSWNFISEQLNGNDKIACNCYVEGMPYSEKNRAGQINAGLDIINAIAKSENVYLPIFVDNAESVVEYIDTECQKILLKVDENCPILTFENR